MQQWIYTEPRSQSVWDAHAAEFEKRRSTLEVWNMTFERITIRPHQMGGVPCIRGLRIPVATVVGMVADGLGEQAILELYPDLEPEDLREALRYAAEALRERTLPLIKAS